jgi:hypothetical protein
MAWAVKLTAEVMEVEQGLGDNRESVTRVISHSPVLEKKQAIWDAYTAAQVRIDEFINMIEPQPKGH